MILLLPALFLGGCATAGALRVDEGVVFSPPDWPQALAGDFYRPAHCARCPVVVLVHGGSWKSGKPTHMRGLAEVLAARGYASFSVQYRLVPDWRFPAQIEDVQLALRWLDREATALGVDAGRIGIWGYSAGAHLASLAALVTDAPRIRAVISGGNPADMIYASTSPMFTGLALSAAAGSVQAQTQRDDATAVQRQDRGAATTDFNDTTYDSRTDTGTRFDDSSRVSDRDPVVAPEIDQDDAMVGERVARIDRN